MTVEDLRVFLEICEPDVEVLIDYGDGQFDMEGRYEVTEIVAVYESEERGIISQIVLR